MNSLVFNGTGTACYYGFANRPPDWIEIRNLESTDSERIEWSRNFRSLECIEGLQFTGCGTTTVIDELGVGEGIIPYDGGDVVASGNATYFIPIGWHPDLGTDQRRANVANGYAQITTWTLDTSGNRTGHWNDQCNTTYIGEGSVIKIREDVTGLVKTAVVIALTSNGEASDEVTLNIAVKSGTIEYIGPLYDFVLAPAGLSMPAGIKINETAAINASGEICELRWGWFDSVAYPG